MSATDELRRLLDERGVEHSDHYLSTTWRDVHGILHLAGEPMADGSLVVDMLTPEQAITATLGDDGYKQAAEYWKSMYEELLTERIGEERDYPEHDGRYECPDCGNVVYYDELHGGGWTIYVEDYQIPFNYCPNCGAKVVGE